MSHSTFPELILLTCVITRQRQVFINVTTCAHAAFTVAVTRAWNSLPHSLHKLSSHDNFRKHFKSLLFKISLPQHDSSDVKYTICRSCCLQHCISCLLYLLTYLVYITVYHTNAQAVSLIIFKHTDDF